mmetsp:Transcript_135377/g.191558  ORF Transcript_135377/g.191558 Transcript_135377/m.191558 type:complete len:202 (-) Transcript_135377:161-766(-)
MVALMFMVLLAPGTLAAPSPSLRGANESTRTGSLPWFHGGCCGGCESPYCSPHSGRCYETKNELYYYECDPSSRVPRPPNASRPTCCETCASAFCSPYSGGCYNAKDKYYYAECQQSAFSQASGFQFQGFDGCSGASRQARETAATSAEACASFCKEASGCVTFLFGRRHGGCFNFLGACHLYATCFPEHNPCWERYLLLQ